MERIDPKNLKFPTRAADAHKGDCGHVLVVGGYPGFSGAARLCGEAALRVGAGLVSIATHPQHAAFMNLTRPELMCHAVSRSQQLQPLLKKADVIAIGPGLSTSPWGVSLFKAVLAAKKPMIIDADALLLWRKMKIKKLYVPCILTPHPGEAAFLLKQRIEEIQKDRAKAITTLRQLTKAVCVLKGAHTLVLGQNMHQCDRGHPGMASAGMGDVLTGMIAGLLGQGLPPEDAAILGVWWHAAAGEFAAKTKGYGLIASDVIEALSSFTQISHFSTIFSPPAFLRKP